MKYLYLQQWHIMKQIDFSKKIKPSCGIIKR